MATSTFGRRIDRAEAAIAPPVAPVIVFHHGVAVPESEIDALVRDELKPHPSQLVVGIKRFGVDGCRAAPARVGAS